jgi:hypothetical protein
MGPGGLTQFEHVLRAPAGRVHFVGTEVRCLHVNPLEDNTISFRVSSRIQRLYADSEIDCVRMERLYGRSCSVWRTWRAGSLVGDE